MDIISPAARSLAMSRIRRRDTKPELIIRRGLHRMGFRFRVDDRRLPGRPDLLFPRRRAALFVHGCFWHGHDCNLFRMPGTRPEFWRAKISANGRRDGRATLALNALDWRVGTVWECALRGKGQLGESAVLTTCAEWLRSDIPTLDIRGVQ